MVRSYRMRGVLLAGTVAGALVAVSSWVDGASRPRSWLSEGSHSQFRGVVWLDIRHELVHINECWGSHCGPESPLLSEFGVTRQAPCQGAPYVESENQIRYANRLVEWADGPPSHDA